MNKISNIAVGNSPTNVIRPVQNTLVTQDYFSDLLPNPTINACYVDSNSQITTTGGDVSDFTKIANKQIKSIYIGKSISPITSKLIVNGGLVYRDALPLNIQQTGIAGMAFNQYVTDTYKTVWGFEGVFQAITGYTNINLFHYGYTNPTAQYQTSYQIQLKASGNNYTVGITYNSYGQSSPTNMSYGTVSLNKWYHLCLCRVGDGNASHGSGAVATTLVYLQELTNPYLPVTYYLPQIYYSNSTWHTSVLSNFSSVTSTYSHVGRQSSNAELNNTIGIAQIGANGIRFAGNIYIKGGAYKQQKMTWQTSYSPYETNTHIGIAPTNYKPVFATDYTDSHSAFTSSTVTNSSTVYGQSQYKWVASDQ